MKKIIRKPQFFFLILALMVLISGFINKEGIIEVAVYGTFVNLKIWSVCLFSAIFFVLVAINYTSLTITKKTPKRVLTVIHIILQIIALAPLLYFIYNANIYRTYEQVSQMNIILILAFILFIIATVIHLINFVASLLTKKD